MRLLTRRLLARFLGTGLRFVLTLTWLALLIALPRMVTKDELAFDLPTLGIIAARSLPFLEASLLVGAPLAAALVLVRLRGGAILPSILTAPRGMTCLRRSIFCFAAFTLVLAAAAFEANSHASGDTGREVDLWRRGGTIAWRPPAEPEDTNPLLLFQPGNLDVERMPAGEGTPEEKGFHPVTAGDALLDLPPPSAWTRAFPAREVLAGLNRVLLPVFLVLVSAYLALLLPPGRLWLIWPLLALLLPLVVSAGLWFSLALGRAQPGAVALEWGWLAVLAATIIVLDRCLTARGFRQG